MAKLEITFDATQLIKQMKAMRFEIMASVSDNIIGEDVDSQLNELGITTDDGED